MDINKKIELADAIIAYLVELQKFSPILPKFNDVGVKNAAPNIKEQLVDSLIKYYKIPEEQVNGLFKEIINERSPSLLSDQGNQVKTKHKLASEFFNLAVKNNPYPMWELIGANIIMALWTIGYPAVLLSGVAISLSAFKLTIAVLAAVCLAIALTNIVHAIIDNQDDAIMKPIKLQTDACKFFRRNFGDNSNEIPVNAKIALN